MTSDQSQTTPYGGGGYNHGYSPDYNKGQYGTGGKLPGYDPQPATHDLPGPGHPAAASPLQSYSPWKKPF